jgi:hypothetical protein
LGIRQGMFVRCSAAQEIRRVLKRARGPPRLRRWHSQRLPREADRGSESTKRRDAKIAEMLECARNLAPHGHYSAMIGAVLRGNGFPEAAEWIDQAHIRRELSEVADQACNSPQPYEERKAD